MIGAMHAASFDRDPKHLGFVLARYKFVSKMLHGYGNVLEVGCGDCTGATIVKPSVGYLCCIDKDITLAAPREIAKPWDMVGAPYFFSALMQSWDAIYALDVLEHIEPNEEARFLTNIVTSLKETGVLIIGTPSVESQPYASELSRRLHVNCKTEGGLRKSLQKFFHNVFMFGMNDETLTTGFGPFCQYRLAVCTNPKGQNV